MTPDAGQCRAGLGDTVEDLERLRPGLHLIALRRLGSSDAAEEAVQETLARAVVALNEGRSSDPDRLPAFVAGIARHVIVDMLRLRGRVLPLDPARDYPHPDPPQDALESLVTTAERARVRAALTLLSAADRDLLQLCFFEGLTPSEVAGRIGEPAERVRKRKSRALERLRDAFRRPAGHVADSNATDRSGHGT